MKAILRSGFLALAIIALAVPANAGPYEDGLAAFDRGDFATALKFFRPLAEQGNTGAQFYLGIAHAIGRGVPQDYAEAVKWFRMAAEQGDSMAQFFLGVSYRQGQGVPQDYKEAVKWYRKSAERGHPKSQTILGVMYSNDRGVPKDAVLAYMWLSLAAAQRYEIAKKRLGSVAKDMTPDQIAEAQRLAREWMEEHQQ